jgi:hypothetical protein
VYWRERGDELRVAALAASMEAMCQTLLRNVKNKYSLKT